MRFLILALVMCAGTSGFCQSAAGAPGAKNTPGPRATLPETWQNAQRSFAVFGAQAEESASTKARTFVAPPQIVARYDGAEPIPGQWPNLKIEPIPTTWPKLKLLLVEKNSAQASLAAKK
jgi:hypothetical protein